jgi:hypothetical protein
MHFKKRHAPLETERKLFNGNLLFERQKALTEYVTDWQSGSYAHQPMIYTQIL